MTSTKNNYYLILAIILIVVAAGLRLIPHAPNFAPIGALALFGGAYLKKQWSYILPIMAMLVSDLFLGFYTPQIMAAVYISFILIVFLGSLARNNKNIRRLAILSLSGSIAFFIITNFTVWAFTPMYQQTLAGLINCYVAALPFFRNTILGDLFYVGVFFGSFEIIKLKLPTRMTQIIPSE